MQRLSEERRQSCTLCKPVGPKAAAVMLMTLACVTAACQTAAPSRSTQPVVPAATPPVSRPCLPHLIRVPPITSCWGIRPSWSRRQNRLSKSISWHLQTDPSSISQGSIGGALFHHRVMCRLRCDLPMKLRMRRARCADARANRRDVCGGRKARQGLAAVQSPSSRNLNAANIFFAKGLLLANQKQYAEAEETIRSGIKVSPDSAVGITTWAESVWRPGFR